MHLTSAARRGQARRTKNCSSIVELTIVFEVLLGDWNAVISCAMKDVDVASRVSYFVQIGRIYPSSPQTQFHDAIEV